MSRQKRNWLPIFKYICGRKKTCSEDIQADNGYVLCDKFIPEDVLILILSFVDKNSLSNKCRHVCKVWNSLIKQHVWKMKAERQHKNMFLQLNLQCRLPWSIYYSIAQNNPFGRNLLKNDSGQNGFNYWEIGLDGIGYGENMWRIESPPIDVPENEHSSKFRTCFVTSFHNCVKRQCIILKNEGLTAEIMDKYQPEISISEWYTSRWDCGAYYRLEVQLLDEKKKLIKCQKKNPFAFQIYITTIRNGWKKIAYTFKSYGPGVRYIMFIHSGKDTQYWAGHFGSKMAAARVEIPLSVLKGLEIKKID